MNFRRAFPAIVVGVTAGLLVALAGLSLATEIGGSLGAGVSRMGVSLGGLVGVVVVAGALLVRGGRRPFGFVLFGLAAVAAFAFLVWAGGRVPARPTLVLSASDRVGLRAFHDGDEEGSEHPSLGFRLPRAPDLDLAASSAIEDEMRAAAAPGWTDAHQIWAFETPDHATSVMIDLSRVDHADHEALASFDRSVTTPLETGGHRVEREPAAGEDGCLRERFRAELTNGGVVDGTLLVFDDGARSLRLVVTAVSDGHRHYDDWSDGITLACERDR